MAPNGAGVWSERVSAAAPARPTPASFADIMKAEEAASKAKPIEQSRLTQKSNGVWSVAAVVKDDDHDSKPQPASGGSRAPTSALSTTREVIPQMTPQPRARRGLDSHIYM